MTTENIDILYELVTSFGEIFTTKDITFKATKYKSTIDLYFNHKVSGHITISLLFDNHNLNVTPKERKIGDIHLSKLINQQFKSLHTDNFIDVMEYSTKMIPQLTSYCVGCGNLLDIESALYINCGKDACVYACEELPIGDFVCNFIKTKPTVAEFLLQTGIESSRSSRRHYIFEPFPHYFMNTTEHMTRGELTALSTSDPDRLNKLKDFKRLDATLSTTIFTQTVPQLMKFISKYDTDLMLEADIKTDAYNLLRFFLMSAEFEINEIDLFRPDEMTGHNTSEFHQYKFQHPPKKEEIFANQVKHNGNETCYLFHGSGRENWYSIMRNGLKVASHSKIMVNAAAYGTGVYMSPHFETSLHYTKTYGRQKCIMGVFEAAAPNPSKWKKTASIFVVPEPRDLILRYILIVPPHLHTRINTLLNTKFSTTLKKEERVQKVYSAKRSNKRLLAELKKMRKSATRKLGLSVDPIEENITIWNAYMHTDGFDPDLKLTKSLKENGIEHIQFELHFPDRYPFEPPFVRVVSPRFKYRTGHITINGAICHEILSHQSWVASYSVEALLIDIRANIMEGEAELEPCKWEEPYSFSAAKVDYDRVMRSHGWK